MGRVRKNIAGQKYGKLTAIKYLYRKGDKSIWLFRCECGNEKAIRMTHVTATNSTTQSCGCTKKPRKGLNAKYPKLYAAWFRIHDRCHNKDCPDYKDYGARGVYVCKRWAKTQEGLENFIADMKVDYFQNATIERIDNDGPYSPENCKWVSLKEQADNRRNTIWIEYRGQKKTLATWCRELNLDRSNTWRRIKRFGWSVEKAFETPKRKQKNGSRNR